MINTCQGPGTVIVATTNQWATRADDELLTDLTTTIVETTLRTDAMTKNQLRPPGPPHRDELDALLQRLDGVRDPNTAGALIASADVRELAAVILSRAQPWWFHADTNLTVFATSADPGTGSAPHDHGLPAVTRCLDGIEGTRRYRLDHAGALHETGIHRLTVGDTNQLDADTIHAVFNCWDRPNLVLHVYLGDFTTSPKHVWDPVTGHSAPLTETAPLAPTR